MGEHGVTLARDDKAAGEQLAALPFGDFVRLTGDQGLVHLDTAGDHFGIGRNLVAGGEDDQVILYQVAGGDGAFDPISNHLGPWGREEGEGVQFFLGMELLDDADGSVGGHHQEENQLSERAHRDQKTGDDIEDDVKEGEEVLQDNPLHRFGGRFWRGVDLASLDPFSNLGGGEARRSLSGGAGGLVQCRHRRASDFWEFGKQKPEALRSPLFMAYHDGQPFNDNHLRPCPMLENPEKLREIVHKSGAHPSDVTAVEEVDDLCAKCDSYAENWQPTADRLWECSHGCASCQKMAAGK